MFKVEISKKGVRMEIIGSTMSVTADLCHVIQLCYDRIKEKDEDQAKCFIEMVKDFVNGWDFDKSADENLEDAQEKCKEEAKECGLEGFVENLNELADVLEKLKDISEKKESKKSEAKDEKKKK